MLTTLPSGRLIHIRPIRPSDKTYLVEGLHHLSQASIYARFLTSKTTFTAAELRYLTEVDGVDHVALLARPLDDLSTMAGVARYVRDPADQTSAELGVVVCDGLHGQGLGTTLGLALADRARDAGIERFTAIMLPENRAALALFHHLSAHLHTEIHDGVRELVAELAVAA